jgi:hypothetical protein
MSTQKYTVDPGLIQMHRDQWLRARDYAVLVVNQLLIQYVHKQTTNRLLEPFMWHTAVLTGTDWPNFQHLRNHPDAHPDFQDLAVAMQAAFDDSKPAIPVDGEYWHTPYVNNSEVIEWENGPGGWPYACKVSAGRCARVSYLRQGEGNDPDSDVSRTDRMLVDGHLSPLEHCARPMTNEEYAESAVYWYEENGKMTWSRDRLSVGKLIRETHYCGNLDGWVSMRKEIPYEWDILGHRAGGSV